MYHRNIISSFIDMEMYSNLIFSFYDFNQLISKN